MAKSDYEFRLRHAKRFHLRRLQKRDSTRFFQTLFIATFALLAFSLCVGGVFWLLGVKGQPNPNPPTGFRLLGAWLITLGVGPTLWFLVHTYRPKLDFYPDSVYVHDWSRSRSVPRDQVGCVSVTSNGDGSTIHIPNLGIEDFSLETSPNEIGGRIESLGFEVKRGP